MIFRNLIWLFRILELDASTFILQTIPYLAKGGKSTQKYVHVVYGLEASKDTSQTLFFRFVYIFLTNSAFAVV